MNTVSNRPIFQPDRAAVIKRHTDAAARKKCLAELERFDRLTALREDLGKLRKCEAAVTALEAEGITIPEKMAEAGIDQWETKARAEVQEHVAAQIVTQLADRTGPELRRCLRAAAESVRQDIATLVAIEDKIAKTYGADRIETDLHLALAALEQSLDAQADGPISFAWHWQPRIAMSEFFSKPL